MDDGTALARHCGVFPGLAEDSAEHALAILKPDFDSILFSEFEDLCGRSGLSIVEIGGETRLSREEHEHLFLDCGDDYCDYMNSGPIRPVLVYGPYASQRLSSIKSAIRIKRELHISSLRNMLHAADDGIEFCRQARFFFPTKRFRSHADLGIEWSAGEYELASPLSRRSVECSWIGLLINFHDLPQFCDSYRQIDLGSHRCMLGIRVSGPTGTLTAFPSPFDYKIFFEAPAREQLAEAVVRRYGICGIERSNGLTVMAEESRSMHYVDIGCRLDEIAAQLKIELLRQAPNRGRGLLALRIAGPGDSFTSADIARRCAARLGWRTWSGSGRASNPEWRTLSRGSFERLVYGMPEL